MVEHRPLLRVFSHAVLWLGACIVLLPLYLAWVASTHQAADVMTFPVPILPGKEMAKNYHAVLFSGIGSEFTQISTLRMLGISLFSAVFISVGKVAISLLSAFAVVYFCFPLRKLCFWAIFVTLMLPVEVRILPTYQVVSDLKLLNTYTGLTLPLMASATATFLFRQFFMRLPDELVEAARLDGASPMRFFWDIVLPLSKASMAAMFVIQFIYGWNQYLWPLLITQENMYPIVLGLRSMMSSSGDGLTNWNITMATALLAMLAPVLVLVVMQKWFVQGLVDQGK